jgi:hypothetical protein
MEVNPYKIARLATIYSALHFLKDGFFDIISSHNKWRCVLYYVECPAIYAGNRKSLFVAGGISGCPDWQKEYVEMLRPLDIAVFNPRRANWKGLDPAETERQVIWEHTHLAKADVISFWFCAETLNPIALYELGFWMNSNKNYHWILSTKELLML